MTKCQDRKAAKQMCQSSHFKDRWKLVIGQSIEGHGIGVPGRTKAFIFLATITTNLRS